jgi:hypothetical protein
MLHRLGAWSDQDERSNLVIDCLGTLLIEMGEAQLDHIAIPQLVVVPADLLVAECRKGASEAVGAMLVGRIIADHPQSLVERSIRERLIIRARENVTPLPVTSWTALRISSACRDSGSRPRGPAWRPQIPNPLQEGEQSSQGSGHASATERDSVT